MVLLSRCLGCSGMFWQTFSPCSKGQQVVSSDMSDVLLAAVPSYRRFSEEIILSPTEVFSNLSSVSLALNHSLMKI